MKRELSSEATNSSEFILEYFPDSAHSGLKAIVGRQAANHGLIKSIVGMANVNRQKIAVSSEESRQKLALTLQNMGFNTTQYEIIHMGDLQAMSRIGATLGLDLVMRNRVWRRRLFNDRAYAVAGLTHSLCSADAMDNINRLVTDPVQPWDALICTSLTAKKTVTKTINNYRAYLHGRGVKAPFPPIQLPIIPLGIDTDKFVAKHDKRTNRKVFREHLGIASDHIAILSFGRIDPFTKSHPYPLIQSVKLAQEKLNGSTKMHLVFVGQFATEKLESDLKKDASQLAGPLEVHFIDGSDEKLSQQSWHGADIFVSFSDNVQETFGLTVVEAMAAGLPVIVSDWNGYRETVENRYVGIKIPTTMPARDSSIGIYFSERHTANLDPYPAYIGSLAQFVSIDISAAVDAITHLAVNSERRFNLGKAAQNHAVNSFDWQVIARRYQRLFADLSKIRGENSGFGVRNAKVEPASILTPDPMRIYSDFASEKLDVNCICVKNSAIDSGVIDLLYRSKLTNFTAHALLSQVQAHQLVKLVEQEPLQIVKILQHFSSLHQNQVLGTCLWLAKYGVLKLDKMTSNF